MKVILISLFLFILSLSQGQIINDSVINPESNPTHIKLHNGQLYITWPYSNHWYFSQVNDSLQPVGEAITFPQTTKYVVNGNMFFNGNKTLLTWESHFNPMEYILYGCWVENHHLIDSNRTQLDHIGFGTDLYRFGIGVKFINDSTYVGVWSAYNPTTVFYRIYTYPFKGHFTDKWIIPPIPVNAHVADPFCFINRADSLINIFFATDVYGNGQIYLQQVDFQGEMVDTLRQLTQIPEDQSIYFIIKMVQRQDSGYIFVYSLHLDDGNYQMYMRMLDADMTWHGEPQLVHDPDIFLLDQPFASVCEHEDGRFYVSWENNNNGFAKIYGRRYTPDGVPIDAPFKVSADTSAKHEILKWSLIKGDSIYNSWVTSGFISKFNVLDFNNPVSAIEDDHPSTPGSFSLLQNYPNPFNPSTTIRYEIYKPSLVNLKIFNINGQEVAERLHAFRQPGKYEINWNGNDHYGNPVASGIYFYKMESKYCSKTRKMLLLR